MVTVLDEGSGPDGGMLLDEEKEVVLECVAPSSAESRSECWWERIWLAAGS